MDERLKIVLASWACFAVRPTEHFGQELCNGTYLAKMAMAVQLPDF